MGSQLMLSLHKVLIMIMGLAMLIDTKNVFYCRSLLSLATNVMTYKDLKRHSILCVTKLYHQGKRKKKALR